MHIVNLQNVHLKAIHFVYDPNPNTNLSFASKKWIHQNLVSSQKLQEIQGFWDFPEMISLYEIRN